MQAIVDVGIEEKSNYSFKNNSYSFICNDPDKLKEKWVKNCPTDYRNPILYYKKIGCTNWSEVQTCDVELNEFDNGTERICNFIRFQLPNSEYLRHAMMQMAGK